jgi:hypothetical protein
MRQDNLPLPLRYRFATRDADPPAHPPLADTAASIAQALAALGKPEPWSVEIEASNDVPGPLVRQFFDTLKLPNVMTTTDDRPRAPFLAHEQIDPEIACALDRIAEVAGRARRAEGLDA